jgi:hypothetical protein
MLGETRNKARSPSPTLDLAPLDTFAEPRKYENIFAHFDKD